MTNTNQPEIFANEEYGIAAHVVPSTMTKYPGFIVTLWDTDAGESTGTGRILPNIEDARAYAAKLIAKRA